jgi:hypothetical protein
MGSRSFAETMLTSYSKYSTMITRARFLLFALFCVASQGAEQTDPLDPETKNYYKSADLAPFAKATEWTIFSIGPLSRREEDDPFGSPTQPKKPKPPADQLFHGYTILGQTKSKVSANLKTVITRIDEAARHWSGGFVLCFFPRHGIRVRVEGIHYDLLICYQCVSAQIYRADKQIGSIYFDPNSTLTPSPAYLNGELIRAKVKLAPPPYQSAKAP